MPSTSIVLFVLRSISCNTARARKGAEQRLSCKHEAAGGRAKIHLVHSDGAHCRLDGLLALLHLGLRGRKAQQHRRQHTQVCRWQELRPRPEVVTSA